MRLLRFLPVFLLCLAGLIEARSPVAAMTFSVVSIGDRGSCGDRCPLAIAAQGEITNSTPDEFASFVSSNATGEMRSVVFLDSPGGKVLSSMQLGQQFRRLGMAAIVARPFQGSGSVVAAGQCYSACVYALMGAQRRIIPPKSRVGIHQMFSYGAAWDPAGGIVRTVEHDDGGMRELLAQYSASMGVSRGLIDAAERTSSGTIHVLSPAEITRWRLGSSTTSLGEGRQRRARR